MVDQPMVLPPGTGMRVSPREVETAPFPENFAFLLNVSGLVGASSFAIAEGHQLRRASHEEALYISKIVKSYSVMGVSPWECRETSPGTFDDLPETDWWYYVIGFQGSNDVIIGLEKVLLVSRLELKIPFTVVRHLSGGKLCNGMVSQMGRVYQQIQNCQFGKFNPVEMREADVDELKLLHSQVRQHDNSVIELEHTLSQLLDLEVLPPYSGASFLGYFGILEGLITHAPKPTDPYDSITRQVKKKLTLLGHRCNPSIDYSPFGGTGTETVWGKMYDCRSSLAHGGLPDFKNNLQALGNLRNAMGLLRQTVKAVIRHALSEPQLVADLREC